MVKPKQKRVEEAKEALKLAQDSLREKQASLAKVGPFYVHLFSFEWWEL